MERTHRSNRMRLPIMVAVIALIAAACSNSSTAPASPSAGGGGAATSAPATMNVELDWVPNPDHVGLYYAQDHGYFTDSNLTVNFRTPSGPADPIKLIGLNKVDLAISYESEMFYAQKAGLPVVAVATVVPVPLNSMIVAPGESVTTLSDMSGKTVGVTGIPSDDAFYLTMLRTAGLSESQVTKVNVGYNLVNSVLANKVDAIIGGYVNVEAIDIEQKSGTKPTVFPADQLGVPNYSELVLVANGDRLQSDAAYADSVKRFVAALVKGTDAAMADPTGATGIMKNDAKDYDSKFLDVSVPLTLTLLKPPSGSKTGCIDTAAWQSFGDWMSQSGLPVASSPDASAITSDAYLPYSCS